MCYFMCSCLGSELICTCVSVFVCVCVCICVCVHVCVHAWAFKLQLILIVSAGELKLYCPKLAAKFSPFISQSLTKKSPYQKKKCLQICKSLD